MADTLTVVVFAFGHIVDDFSCVSCANEGFMSVVLLLWVGSADVCQAINNYFIVVGFYILPKMVVM